MKVAADANGGEDSTEIIAERLQFLKYLAASEGFSQDECNPNGGMKGATREFDWLHGRWQSFTKRPVHARWLNKRFQEYGFEWVRKSGVFKIPVHLLAIFNELPVCNTEPTRELDPEHMTREEHMELAAAQMALRGDQLQLAGLNSRLRGLLMRPNAMLQTDKIESVFVELEMLLKRSREDMAKLRKAS